MTLKEPGKKIVSPDGSLLGPGDKVPGSDGLPRACNETRRVYLAWRRAIRNDVWPRLADWDPTPVSDLVPSILIVDVLSAAHDYRYRIVGTREIEVRGYDPTGRTVRDCYDGEVLDFALENYDLAIRQPNGLIDFSIEVYGDRRFIELETLLLPLSDDGATASHVLVYSHYLEKQ